MKLDVSEFYSVSGLTGAWPTLAEALAAIDDAGKPGGFTITFATKVVASGAGINPGQPALGQPTAGMKPALAKPSGPAVGKPASAAAK
jgi:hypothetical protein